MPERALSERWVGPNAGVPEGMPVPATRDAVARVARRNPSGIPKRGDGWRLTPADQRVLTTLTRYSVASWRQLSSAWYGGADRTTNRRLGYLRESGCVKVSRNDEWAGRVYMPTAAGVRLIRKALPVSMSAPQQHPGERLLHRLAVVDAGLRWETGGRRVLTEREIRTAEASRVDAEELALGLQVPGLRPVRDGLGNPRWFAVPVGSQGKVHYPDLVLVTAEGLTAVEVELAPKERPRMREILRGYRDSRLYRQVVYLTTPQVQTLLWGYRGAHGDWVDGVLQELKVAPAGPPREQAATVNDPVRVSLFEARDPGVTYRLDMRQMPQAWWVSKSAWEQLRDRWEADSDRGRAIGVPFLRWWQHAEGLTR